MGIATSLEYRIDEPSFSWNDANKTTGTGVFELRPPGVPANAIPIYDEHVRSVVGYHEDVAGVSRIYSVDGVLHLAERPLETPLFDPLDFVFIVGGFWRAGVRGFTQWGIRGLGASIAEHMLFGLRSRYYAIAREEIRFAAKPLMHMSNPDRFVPVHILRLTIRYGKRSVDPAGIKGLSMYTYPIRCNGKPYMLEVLLREKDYTVLHFVYKK